MMMRIGAAGLVLALGSLEVSAQSGRHAIEREERRIDRRIDPNRPSPDGAFDDPDDVVGFDGPPDPMEDGVERGGPLPPGAPVEIDDD